MYWTPAKLWGHALPRFLGKKLGPGQPRARTGTSGGSVVRFAVSAETSCSTAGELAELGTGPVRARPQRLLAERRATARFCSHGCSQCAVRGGRLQNITRALSTQETMGYLRPGCRAGMAVMIVLTAFVIGFASTPAMAAPQCATLMNGLARNFDIKSAQLALDFLQGMRPSPVLRPPLSPTAFAPSR